MTSLGSSGAPPAHLKHAHALGWLMRFGALGLFAISAIDSSVVPIPLPGSTDLLELLLVARGGNPWLMAGAAIVGSVLGGYITWKAGKKGGDTALKSYEAKRYFQPLNRWVKRNGMLAVAFAALVPPPLPLLPFLLAAGALGVSKRKFFISFTLARTVRYGLVAWLAVRYARQLVHAWTRYLAPWSTPITCTIVVLMVGGIAFGFWKYRKMRRQAEQARKADRPMAEARG